MKKKTDTTAKQKTNHVKATGKNSKKDSKEIGFDVDARRSFKFDEDSEHSFEVRD